MATKTSGPDELVYLQRQSLVAAIKEAQQSENERLKRIENVKSKASAAQLKERYEKERLRDQEKLTRLLQDYEQVRELKADGSLGIVHSNRKNQKLEPGKTKRSSTEVSRFHGFESITDLNFQKGRIESFEISDLIHARRNAPRYDEYAEKRKLKLLHEKRVLISNLVSLHSSELQAGIFILL